tara:strand:- start:4332 stop:5285 length:954 start_codon:yes stop_codon:yes gene_type:complete
MGLLDIDYDNLVVKKDIVKDRTIFTIDNFYKYPNMIIKVYNELQQRIPTYETTNDKYPGRRMDMLDLLSENIIDRHIDDLKKLLITHGFDHSKFLSKNEETELNTSLGYRKSGLSISKFDKKIGLDNPVTQTGAGSMANPHSDGSPRGTCVNRLACICYLSKDVHGGTGVYRNKELDVYSLDAEFSNKISQQVIQKLESVGARSLEEQATIIENMYTNLHRKLFPRKSSDGFMNETNEHYEMLHLFSMKFNRIIVYDSDLLHAMYMKDVDFFDTHERLTSNYFILQKWMTPSIVQDRFENLLKISKKFRPGLTSVLL